VIGISPDSPKSHRKFKTKYDLTYPLIADEDHAIAERYGVWVKKSMFGRKYWGVARTTFVIDRGGRVAKVFEQVKPDDHAAEVADAVAELAARD
jgi:peroxiredoxin Q/BCP